MDDYRRAAFALFRDADEMLREELLGSEARPLVSYEHDLAGHQDHKGWRFGYLAQNGSEALVPLDFRNAGSTQVGAMDGCGVRHSKRCQGALTVHAMDQIGVAGRLF